MEPIPRPCFTHQAHLVALIQSGPRCCRKADSRLDDVAFLQGSSVSLCLLSASAPLLPMTAVKALPGRLGTLFHLSNP